jgi:hypothetical protein
MKKRLGSERRNYRQMQLDWRMYLGWITDRKIEPELRNVFEAGWQANRRYIKGLKVSK